MHVFKFLESRGWASQGEGLIPRAGEAPKPAVVDAPGAELPLEGRTLEPRAEIETTGTGRGQDWHNRPPGWALRWEGSALTLIEE
jgi:hypothetical protein